MIFYVYAHYTLDTDRLFYVGKGSGDRDRIVSSRNRHWRSVVGSHGFRSVRVADGLAESDALSMEVELIAFLREEGVSLCNATDGGDGVTGMRHTAESRARIASALSVRVVSDETRAKLSGIHKGKSWSAARRAAKSAAMRGRLTDGQRRALAKGPEARRKAA